MANLERNRRDHRDDGGDICAILISFTNLIHAFKLVFVCIASHIPKSGRKYVTYEALPKI